MRKRLFLLTTGTLAALIAGCQGDSGNQASPSPSSPSASPTVKASASPKSSASASPFASPVVTPQPSDIAAAPGLIPATNPDDRAKQVEGNLKTGTPQNPTAPLPPRTARPLTTQTTALADPFGPLPPQPLQNDTVGRTNSDSTNRSGPSTRLPKLAEQKVPDLPVLSAIGRPPQIVATRTVGNRPLPNTAVGNRSGQNLSLPNGGGAAAIGTTPQLPGLNPPALGVPGRVTRQTSNPLVSQRPIGVAPPTLPGTVKPQGVPELPRLPVDKRPTQWQNPNRTAVRSAPNIAGGGRVARRVPAVVRPPALPVAAKPLGVPELPKLPVDNRPPQWVDPNPRPVATGPKAPPPPSTDIARGIEVSGVVKVGNEIQVIVKVPTEPTSRYVKIGQRLANGQVLVKRVDLKPGVDPVIVLEQNGVEVAKAVGENAGSPVRNAGSAIASVPRTVKH